MLEVNANVDCDQWSWRYALPALVIVLAVVAGTVEQVLVMWIGG